LEEGSIVAAGRVRARACLAGVLCLGLSVRPAPGQDTVRTGRAGVQQGTGDSTRKKRAPATKSGAAKKKARSGHSTMPVDSAALARDWPVKGPDPLPGSILPNKRVVAFYGNPLSKRMGVLGELPPDQMLARLDTEVARWRAADSTTPVLPALHLIVVVAQGSPGKDGKYRLRMTDSLVKHIVDLAAKRNALVFLDVQVAQSTLREELPRLAQFLKLPNVHLGIDPEFSMKGPYKPGSRIGTYDAADVNYASSMLAELVTNEKLPPKLLIVHRFTRPMLTHSKRITLDPRVQIVIDMDGWGPPSLKIDSYNAYVAAEPVQFTGFKLFYRNDTKKGDALMSPKDVLRLTPRPLYIQYQ
jgi:hypothetical protein